MKDAHVECASTSFKGLKHHAAKFFRKMVWGLCGNLVVVLVWEATFTRRLLPEVWYLPMVRNQSCRRSTKSIRGYRGLCFLQTVWRNRETHPLYVNLCRSFFSMYSLRKRINLGRRSSQDEFFSEISDFL
jgi:hypothetical protein